MNTGAYERPFSGVGIEYYPLGMKPDLSGITLHETGYLPCNAQWNFPSVFSPFWRIYYNSERGHCVLFGGRMVELTPDHITLIPAHQHFHCLGKHPVPSFWMAFNFAKHLHHDIDIPIQLKIRDTESCLIRDLKTLITANENRDAVDVIYRNSLALLQVVLARHELRWMPPIPENIMQIKKYIDEHLKEKITNSILAQKAGMSMTKFECAFKLHYGITIAKYVTEARISEACHRLLQTEDSIDLIADDTGFPNRAYFSRIFKKVTGSGPATFRRKHRGNIK